MLSGLKQIQQSQMGTSKDSSLGEPPPDAPAVESAESTCAQAPASFAAESDAEPGQQHPTPQSPTSNEWMALREEIRGGASRPSLSHGLRRYRNSPAGRGKAGKKFRKGVVIDEAS